ncbi:MAG: helix-turn-helix domain-containing protein [Bryobacteraceae bacterium]|nr:helix-turn-helix domain-containing protein [Bryobacteraceae bacterium]
MNLGATQIEPKATRRERPPINARPWMNAQEAADYIGVSRSQVYRLSNGKIPGVPLLPSRRVGKLRRVWLRTQLDQWQVEGGASC